jgi:hypothetical protein
MLSFGEMARAMAIDDATMVRHIDALLRDFVADNPRLFGFRDEPVMAESALSKAGWTVFRGGHLRLRDDDLLPRLELVGDHPRDQRIARRQNRRLVKLYESMQDTGAIDPFFSMADP